MYPEIKLHSRIISKSMADHFSTHFCCDNYRNFNEVELLMQSVDEYCSISLDKAALLKVRTFCVSLCLPLSRLVPGRMLCFLCLCSLIVKTWAIPLTLTTRLFFGQPLHIQRLEGNYGLCLYLSQMFNQL